MFKDKEIVVAKLSGGASIVMRTGPEDLRVVKVLLRRSTSTSSRSGTCTVSTDVLGLSEVTALPG